MEQTLLRVSVEVTPQGSVRGTCCIPRPVLLLGIQLSLPGPLGVHPTQDRQPLSVCMDECGCVGGWILSVAFIATTLPEPADNRVRVSLPCRTLPVC